MIHDEAIEAIRERHRKLIKENYGNSVIVFSMRPMNGKRNILSV